MAERRPVAPTRKVGILGAGFPDSMTTVPFKQRAWRGARALAWAATLGLGLWEGAAFGQYPAAVLPVAPVPAPDFPSNFAPFSPPMTIAAPATGTPALAEWNRSAEPGESLTFTGSRLSAFTDDEAGTDTSFVAFGQTGRQGVIANSSVNRLVGDHAAVTLGAALPKRSLYLVWPRNSHGYGRPALVNATEAWWVGPDRATRGDRFAVYGRNLTPDGERRSYLYLQDATGNGRWIKSTFANPYRADFFVPAATPNGDYHVWMHNSLGGALGWSGPLKLTVADGQSWTGPTFNVRTFGAKGDGVADDFLPITGALAAAGAMPGSTIYFPPGKYAISSTIAAVPPQVRWRGAGSGVSRIVPHAPFAAANDGLILAAFHDVEMRDLTFDTAGILDAALGNNLLQIRGSSRVTFTRVGFDQSKDYTTSDAAPIDLHLCDHITFRGCDIRAAGGMFFGTSRQLFLDGCRFRGLNDLAAFIYVWGGSEISISGCSAADFDSRNPNDGHGWAQGRFVAGMGKWSSNRHFYFGQNRTVNLTVREANSEQNTGEQFLFEGLDTFIRGNPDHSGANWVQFHGLTDDYTGQILVVIAGTGVGQSRQVTAFDTTSGKLTVDAPWVLQPDTTSLIVVGHYMSRMAVYGNYFSGKPRAVASDTHVASAAVEPFGGCVELVVANNTMQRIRYGISNWSMTNDFGANEVLQPNFFNEFLDNRFVSCRQGIVNLLKRWQPTRPNLNDTGMLGNLYRGNRFSHLTDPAFTYQISDGPAAIQMGVFDRNEGDQSPYVTTDNAAGMRDQILTGNRFRGSPAQP